MAAIYLIILLTVHRHSRQNAEPSFTLQPRSEVGTLTTTFEQEEMENLALRRTPFSGNQRNLKNVPFGQKELFFDIGELGVDWSVAIFQFRALG